MVSYDVKQSFTKIPTDLALEAVTEALENNEIVNAKFSKDSILKLTTLCLKSPVFQFDN